MSSMYIRFTDLWRQLYIRCADHYAAPKMAAAGLEPALELPACLPVLVIATHGYLLTTLPLAEALVHACI